MARQRQDGDDAGEMVEVPAGVLHQMQERLANLEHADRIRREAEVNPRARILDKEYEAWKVEAGRPAAERTQDIADRLFDGPQAFRVALDSTKEDGKPGPRVSEHPAVVIRANSPEEAEGRWLKLCGVKKHDYVLKTERVADAA